MLQGENPVTNEFLLHFSRMKNPTRATFSLLNCQLKNRKIYIQKKGKKGLKNQEFVQAAQVMGVSNISMFRRHILPNILGPIAIYATLTIPQVMLLEAFLSFLGLGIQPPMSSWGTLIRYGVESMEEYYWLLIYPGLTFTITLFALNFFDVHNILCSQHARTGKNRNQQKISHHMLA